MNKVFDNIVDRRCTNSCKWDSIDKKYIENKDMIHLGVADMDFKCPSPIIDSIQKVVDKGIFGYTDLNERFYDSFIYWMRKVHLVDIKKKKLYFVLE